MHEERGNSRRLQPQYGPKNSGIDQQLTTDSARIVATVCVQAYGNYPLISTPPPLPDAAQLLNLPLPTHELWCWSGLDQLLVDVLGVDIEFVRCILVGRSSSTSLDFNRWCISAYPAVARPTVASDQLLVFQVIPLAVALTQLDVPQEVDRVSQLCIVFVCTGITLGGMSRVMLRSI
ncbi:carboxylesterase 1-like [Dorcoceras hygrometricum]|uniref:Carboxylesterase 1-like n=1 Tax=Dorcoceras hygrometricum TaxID=472368 RepID=A0A2Z7AWP9_9LAMI|nr:carboxylesterase 1-like [Dorcoceras hygrometricum]